MKAVIITEGGQGIGFGHITRCLSLYDAFKAKGIPAELIISGDRKVRDFLKGRKFRVFDWLNQKEKLSSIINSADAVIIDSYRAGQKFYDKFSEVVKVPVYIDDNIRLDYPAGIIINGSVGAESFSYGNKEGRICLLGEKYIPLRSAFWSVTDKKIGNDIKSVLITFGGADNRNLTPKVLRLLVKECPRWKKIVIIGMGYRNAGEIKRIKDMNTRIIYQPDADALKKNMIAADIAISAGGQTLYELARVGVPTIAIAVADNQANNIRGWNKRGFIEFAGYWNGRNIAEKVLMAVTKLKDKKRRRRMSLAGRKLVDGMGSKRIADLLSAKSA